MIKHELFLIIKFKCVQVFICIRSHCCSSKIKCFKCTHAVVTTYVNVSPSGSEHAKVHVTGCVASKGLNTYTSSLQVGARSLTLVIVMEISMVWNCPMASVTRNRNKKEVSPLSKSKEFARSNSPLAGFT